MGGGKRISKEIKQKALELFRQGLGSRAASATLNLSRSTVQNWYAMFLGGNLAWVNSTHQKHDINVLKAAVEEYLTTASGCSVLSTKYGIPAAALVHAKQNYLNYGVVVLPQGRKPMKRLQEQKQSLQSDLTTLDTLSVPLTNPKDLKEMRDLLLVNIALLEVLEESHPDELKKKEFRQQKKQLKVKLASVRHALS